MNKPLSILTILLIIFTVIQTIVFVALLSEMVNETNVGSISGGETAIMLFVMIFTLPLNLFLAVKSYKKDSQSPKEIRSGLDRRTDPLIIKLSKNKNLFYIFGVILILFGLFFWFQIRPSNIRSNCIKQARLNAGEFVRNQASLGDYYYQDLLRRGAVPTKLVDNYYERCLKENGINK